MSSSLITAHTDKGGSVMSGIITNTMAGAQKDIKEKHLDRLVTETTGVPMGRMPMDGVITSTVPTGMKSIPEHPKVPDREVGKTKSKRMGQVPYNGPKY